MRHCELDDTSTDSTASIIYLKDMSHVQTLDNREVLLVQVLKLLYICFCFTDCLILMIMDRI